MRTKIERLVAISIMSIASSDITLANSTISAADLLLKRASHGSSAPVPAPEMVRSTAEFKLNDPFAVQFYSEWQANHLQLPPEVNHWATLLLKEQFEEATHLWGGIEKQLPVSFLVPARLAHFRALGRLGLVQAAVESWMEFLAHSPSGWMASGKPVAAVFAFDASWTQILQQPLDQLLFRRGFLVSPELQISFSKLNPRLLSSIPTLQAVGFLRKGEQGKALLEVLPPGHAFKLPLAQTVALGLAKRGDLAAAASTLKVHAEAAVEETRDLKKLSSHLLQIARFLFQAGLWEESETYYRKIPNSTPEFMSAREELAWVLLRKGNTTHLRGEVVSLSTPGSKDTFHPEVPVVRAISNLKLCSFGGVQKDFMEFQQNYGPWAKKVETALAQPETPSPEQKDTFTQQSEERTRFLASELHRLTGFYNRSVQSGLPSVVGRQSHWKKWVDTLSIRLELSKKITQSEYRRQWKNQKALLAEAIRKMRFIKVELLHQMRVFSREPTLSKGGMDSVSLTQAAPEASEGQVVFPVDGVLWPDEFFKIQGQVEQRCLKGISK